MIHTIIFDFGGVIVEDMVERFELTHGRNRLSPQKRAAYETAVTRCELGKSSYRQFFGQARDILAPQLTVAEMEKWLLQHTRILPPYTLARRLSKRCKVIILSNNFRGWHKKIMAHAGISLPGIPFVNSATIGKRKQTGAAFRYAIKKWNLRPAECIFIDDHAYNTGPAKTFGFRTFLYKNNPSKLKHFLKKSGIHV